MTPILLVDARRHAGLTQDELAAKSGVDQTTISALERRGRKRSPGFDTVVRLARALGLNAEDLRFGRPAEERVA